jgi:hypothetical protein
MNFNKNDLVYCYDGKAYLNTVYQVVAVLKDDTLLIACEGADVSINVHKNTCKLVKE